MRGIFITVLALVAASAAQFTGPCTDSNCGVSGENCEAEGRQCFPFPNVNPALREGCVCGSGFSGRHKNTCTLKTRVQDSGWL
ncbi:EC87 protein [Colletotrichum asianum]